MSVATHFGDDAEPCKDCGAKVTPTDRFCPACGTPNASTKFHPKFGPALRTVEPRILSDAADEGTPSCPRCDRAIAPDQEYCAGCGMELETAWQRIERVEVLDSWRDEMDLQPFREAGRIGVALQAGLYVSMVTALAVGVGNAWLYARSAGRMEQGPATVDLLRVLDGLTAGLAIMLVLSYVLLVRWMWRAYRNLPALAVSDLRYKQGWVVAGWLVPIVQLIRPKRVVDDLWRASDPTVPPFTSAWRRGPASEWSTLWWAALLIGGVFGVASRLVAPTTTDVQSLAPALALAALSGVLLFGSSLCLRLLVQRTNERQEARAALIAGRAERDEAEFVAAVHAREDEAAGPVLLARPNSRDAIAGRY